jgi:TPR repeat protein
MAKSLLFQFLTVAVLGLNPGFARADLYSASKVFDEKDYERAFQSYRELAELGQFNAQENLAVMYVIQGVTKSEYSDLTSFMKRTGKKAEAQKDQRKALKIARGLGWETASQQARLANYVASKSWTGDLFAF